MIGVTGASGWVGQAVVKALKDRDVRVLRLGRNPRDGEVNFDLLDPEWAARWAPAFRQCEAIIHCAAHVHIPNETVTEERRFTEINVTGTQRVVEACTSAGVARLVFVSTLAVYDWQSKGAPRREGDELAPASAYGHSKVLGEAVVKQSSLDWRVARLATVYGSGDRANFARLAAALCRGRFVIPGRGEARKSVLPIERAGSLLAQIALKDGLSGSIMNLASPVAPSLSEICDGFVEICSFPPPRRLPLALLRALAIGGDAIERVAGRFPLTSDIVSKLTTSTVVDVSRVLLDFPDEPWASFKSSLAAARDHYIGMTSKIRTT